MNPQNDKQLQAEFDAIKGFALWLSHVVDPAIVMSKMTDEQFLHAMPIFINLRLFSDRVFPDKEYSREEKHQIIDQFTKDWKLLIDTQSDDESLERRTHDESPN